MQDINYSEEEFRNLSQAQNGLTQECRAKKYKYENLRAANERFNFDFQDPEPNFDRRRIHGMFCKLFKPVSDDYRQALEICAASKVSLLNIFVLIFLPDKDFTG